jgi:hypothetical protein
MKTSAQLVLVLVAIVLGFNACATTFYVDAGNLAPAAPYTNWPTASKDIQSAVDVATDGDLILVTNGLYNTGGRVVYGSLTNRVVINKAVAVRSINGPVLTTIQGYQSAANSGSNNVRVVYMTNNVVLDGFTIAGGATLGSGSDAKQLSGGGVFCESRNTTLTNCIITGNLVRSAPGVGGGIYQGTLNSCILSNNICTNSLSSQAGGAASSILNNCLIIGNSANEGGGAAFSTLNHCSIIGNIAPFALSVTGGGGIYGCTANYCLITSNLSMTVGGGDSTGILNFCLLNNNVCSSPSQAFDGGDGGGSYAGRMLNNCLVASNYCNGNGGGVYSLSATSSVLINCTIVGNTAYTGGGAFSGTLSNCLIIGNVATAAGGGTWQSTLNNCTVATNSANLGCGVYQGTLHNCIVYYNYGASNPNYYNGTLTYCCTTPLPAGTGNFTNVPLFVNFTNDFHLQSNSPCINAGNNAFVTGTTDLDGNPRIVGGTVDMGAYEYQTPTSLLSYAWAQQYGLPTDGTADTIDSDGDGMKNWQEWIAGTIPTNAASVLQLSSPSNSLSGMKVTWQSVSGVTYYLQRSTNLAAQPPFSSIVSNLTGQAVSTSYTDTSATNGGPYFYRVGVQ